jgi:hypothetical protein
MPPTKAKPQGEEKGQKRGTKEDPPASELAINSKKVRLEKDSTDVQERSDKSGKKTEEASDEGDEEIQDGDEESSVDEFADIRRKPKKTANDDANSDGGAGDANVGNPRDGTPISTPGSGSSRASTSTAGNRGLASESSYMTQKADAKRQMENARSAIIGLQEKDLKDQSQRLMLEKLVAFLNTCIAFERVIAEALEAANDDEKESWKKEQGRSLQMRNDFRENPGEMAIKIILRVSTYTWARRKGVADSAEWQDWPTKWLLSAVLETQKQKKDRATDIRGSITSFMDGLLKARKPEEIDQSCFTYALDFSQHLTAVKAISLDETLSKIRRIQESTE